MRKNKFFILGWAVWAVTAGVWGQTSNLGFGSSTNTTLINARTMNFDYQKHVATFHGDVVVADPSIKIMADSMRVDFTEQNTPKVITAEGRVKIWQGDRIAVSKKAVYTVATGELILTGQPVLTQGANRMAGTRVIFYRDTENVQVDNMAGTFTPPAKTNETRSVKE